MIEQHEVSSGGIFGRLVGVNRFARLTCKMLIRWCLMADYLLRRWCINCRAGFSRGSDQAASEALVLNYHPPPSLVKGHQTIAQPHQCFLCLWQLHYALLVYLNDFNRLWRNATPVEVLAPIRNNDDCTPPTMPRKTRTRSRRHANT